MQQSIFKSVFPNYNELFYNHFNTAAQNTCYMANLLQEAVNNTDDQKPQFNLINRLRAKSQEITREVYTDSGKAFVSPFERYDMCNLAKAIDNVAGYINIASRRINLYQPRQITPAIKNLTHIIVEVCAEVENCISALSRLSNHTVISKCINHIKKLEHDADRIYNNAVADLMITEPDAIELIKFNEILLALETATDKCEQLTIVVETIMIKNK